MLGPSRPTALLSLDLTRRPRAMAGITHSKTGMPATSRHPPIPQPRGVKAHTRRTWKGAAQSSAEQTATTHREPDLGVSLGLSTDSSLGAMSRDAMSCNSLLPVRSASISSSLAQPETARHGNQHQLHLEQTCSRCPSCPAQFCLRATVFPVMGCGRLRPAIQCNIHRCAHTQ